VTSRLAAIFALAAFGSAGAAGPPPSVDSGIPLACKLRGGWVIEPLEPLTAGISIGDCGDHMTIELEQLEQSGSETLRTTRAVLHVPREVGSAIVPCGGVNDPRLQSGITVLPAPDYTRQHPALQRAWKADLTSWTLTEVDPASIQCTLPWIREDD